MDQAPVRPRHALDLPTIVRHFADALVEIDHSGATHKSFKPGIGPFGEDTAVREAFTRLKVRYPESYGAWKKKRAPDVLLPGEWGLEFKIIRPFGDNGACAEHWSENVLHPYPGNTSAIGDCFKLLQLDDSLAKAVVIFGFEHSPVQIDLDCAVRGFQLLAQRLLDFHLGPMIQDRREGLIHPVHQVLRVFAFEVLGRSHPCNET